jgi:hypothetical protein
MPKRQQHDSDDDPFDERGVLSDGGRIRVPMMMRDSDDGLTALQRSVRDATAPLRVVDAFGNSGLALSRPGPRYLAAGEHTSHHAVLVMLDHQRREARDQYVADLQDAWKGNNTARGTRSQDSAPRGPVYDAVEGQRVKDAAYAEMVNELVTAWQRKPVGVRR